MEYTRVQLAVPDTRLRIARLSPSFGLLVRLADDATRLDGLTWRQFEELIADLLERDSYAVKLGPGRNDGGYDILATKDLGPAGLFSAVWQAKKLRAGNKVELAVVRELADARDQEKASKGIIATTSFLTRGALDRVRRDAGLLGKVDRQDLVAWIAGTVRGQRTQTFDGH